MRINLTTFLTSTATKITNDDDHSTTENSGSATSDSREQLQQVIVGLSVTSRACSMKKTMELNFFLQLLGYFNISQLQSSKACPFENEILLVIEFYERVSEGN